MPTIYEYEVEMSARPKSGGSTVSVTRLEMAYSLLDATMQATCNSGMAETHDLKLLRVGPPERAIRESASRQLNDIADGVADLFIWRATTASPAKS